MRDAHEILGELVQADVAAGSPEIFVLSYTMEGPEIIGHPGWSEEVAAPTFIDIDELADRGWLRITQSEGKTRQFAVTSAGRQEAMRRAAQASIPVSPGVSLEWSSVRPVLEQLYDAYRAAGAPEHGVQTAALVNQAAEPASVLAALRELVRAGYLEDLAEVEQQDAPRLVRPTPLALERVAGWPGSGPQAALDELVAALDAEIDRTTDEEKRSKLSRVRDGLLGAARDVALAYFEKKIMGS